MKLAEEKLKQTPSGTFSHFFVKEIYWYNETTIVNIMWNSYSFLFNCRLHRHLYYTNSIEWSASAMEMSVIAAKNIANMVYRDWEGKFSRIISAVTKNVPNDDEHDTTVKQQSEL